MSSNRGMDKNVVNTYNGLLLNHKIRTTTTKKKTEIVQSAEMWMDVEALIQSEVNQRKANTI